MLRLPISSAIKICPAEIGINRSILLGQCYQAIRQVSRQTKTRRMQNRQISRERIEEVMASIRKNPIPEQTERQRRMNEMMMQRNQEQKRREMLEKRLKEQGISRIEDEIQMKEESPMKPFQIFMRREEHEAMMERMQREGEDGARSKESKHTLDATLTEPASSSESDTTTIVVDKDKVRKEKRKSASSDHSAQEQEDQRQQQQQQHQKRKQKQEANEEEDDAEGNAEKLEKANFRKKLFYARKNILSDGFLQKELKFVPVAARRISLRCPTYTISPRQDPTKSINFGVLHRRSKKANEEYYRSLMPSFVPLDPEKIDVKKEVLNIWQSFTTSPSDQDLKGLNLQHRVKFLLKCIRFFQREIPSFSLCNMNSVRDVISFFSQPLPRNSDKFENIDFSNLPKNLTIRRHRSMLPESAEANFTGSAKLSEENKVKKEDEIEQDVKYEVNKGSSHPAFQKNSETIFVEAEVVPNQQKAESKAQ